MAANRTPTSAPILLLGLSKASLADLVWELAGRASFAGLVSTRSLVILDVAKAVAIPRADLRTVERLVRGPGTAAESSPK